jgi:glycosyltransferase involved in cell wall biosynthesis
MADPGERDTTPRPPLVLVLNHAAAPRSAPGGTRHIDLFSQLEGWDFAIIAANRNALTGEPVASDPPHFLTVPTLRHEGNGPRRIGSWIAYALTATIRAMVHRRPTIVYASTPHLLTGLSGYILARARHLPFVLEVRDIWPQILLEMNRLQLESRAYRILRALELHLYEHADMLVVLAEGTRKYLQDLGIPPSKITYIPNGSDPSDFDVSDGRDDIRRELGLDGFVIAYTGAHGLANGLDLVLDAAAKVQPIRDDVRWILVGDGPEKARLVAAARSRNLTSVQFWDPIPKDEIPRFLAAVDVGLHCLADVELFKSAISPNKLFDYLAAGLPVITNTRGDIGDLIRNINAGLAVDPSDLAEAALDLAGRPGDDLHDFGRSGRTYMQSFQSRTVLADRLARSLGTLLSPAYEREPQNGF